VDGKTNEITRFEPRLEDLDLAGCVITADALHTQRETAEFVVTTKNAHYILIVKKNQPGLYATIKNLPWKDIPRRSQPAEPRPRPAGARRPENRRRRAAVPARGQGHPHHPPRPADRRHREVEDLHRIRRLSATGGCERFREGMFACLAGLITRRRPL
jgi:Transposase DDE domain